MGDVQISQVLAEVDAQNSAPDIQITQILAEVDAQNSAPDIQITQILAEVDAQNSAPDIQITQLMAEVDVDPYVVSVSQVFVEADIDPVSTLIASQVFVEADIDPVSTLIASQVFVEADIDTNYVASKVKTETVQIRAVYSNGDVGVMRTPSAAHYTVYADARAGLPTTNFSQATCGGGQLYSVGEYEICRGLLRFDTSSIPEEATITSVKMSVYPFSTGTCNSDRYLRILKYDWSSGPDWEGILAAEVQAGYFYVYPTIIDDYHSLPYDSGPLSVSWINKEGHTYYGLVMQDDLDAVAPAAPCANTWFLFYSGSSPSEAPYLTITYTVPVGAAKAMSGLSGMSGSLT